jgi:phosphate acetyltransferase
VGQRADLVHPRHRVPGPGTVCGPDLKFWRPITIGDTLTVTITCTHRFEHNHHLLLECLCVNQDGLKVIDGTAEVMAPTEKIKRPRIALPGITISDRQQRYLHVLEMTKGMEPIPIAVAHPCDTESLRGPLQARDAGLVIPVLVGPEAKIREVAEREHLDLRGVRIIDVPHSHASAATAVKLARSGEVEALMKGSLHTDELMSEVVARETGLRTARRLSHVFMADVPTYPHPLLITDAAINIEPTLEDKVHIIQNAIELAIMMGVPEPKVAILSAVETVNVKIRSTLDAAALCKMADRGQIKGGLLDGPLAFDNAVPGRRQDQGHPLGGGRPGRHPGRARPRIRQHGGQAARIPGRRADGRRGARRPRAHRAHQPRRYRRNPHRLLRHRAVDGPQTSPGVRL